MKKSFMILLLSAFSAGVAFAGEKGAIEVLKENAPAALSDSKPAATPDNISKTSKTKALPYEWTVEEPSTCGMQYHSDGAMDYPDGRTFRYASGAMDYPDGRTFRYSSGAMDYPDGRTLRYSSGAMDYPDGKMLRSSGGAITNPQGGYISAEANVKISVKSARVDLNVFVRGTQSQYPEKESYELVVKTANRPIVIKIDSEGNVGAVSCTGIK